MGHVEFEEPWRSPSGDGEYTIGYTGLKLRGEVWKGDVTMGVVNMAWKG